MSRGLFLILFAIVSLSFVNAQETPRLAEQPVFLARFHGWTEQGTRRYLQDLKHDLEIGGTFLTQMDRPEAKENSGSLEDPTSGMMVYLTQGLIPSVEQISFTEVADETEFRKFVQIHKRQHGESGVLEGADEKYKLFVSRVVRVELPDEPTSDRNETDGDSGTGVEQASESDAAESDVSDREPVSVSVGIGTQGLLITETKTLSRVTEENGKRYQVDTTEDATWYRLHEGFMFTAKTEALWSMSLPSADILREHSNSERNAVLAFYPDRIPMGLRQVAWGALNAAAGSVLQQHDDEKDDAYAMRQFLVLGQCCAERSGGRGWTERSEGSPGDSS